MKKYFFILPVVFSTFAYASNEVSPVTTIKNIRPYHDYGNGDVVFELQNKATTCTGYWIDDASPGATSTLAVVIAALQNNTNVQATGKSDLANKWQGSSSHFCKLDSIIVLK